MNEKVSTFFIDFDSLFDTRLGTLFQYAKEIADENLTMEYFLRDCDDFKGLPFEDFRSLYSRRNKATLKASLKTPMVDFVLEFVAGIYKNSINGYDRKTPKIVFNTYPYSLDLQEIKLIEETWVAMTKGFCSFEFVYLQESELTPAYIREKIDAISMYDYPSWLELHSVHDILRRTPSSGTAFFGPRLHFKRVSQEEKAFLKNEGLNPFEEFEKVSAPLYSFHTLQPYFYSAALLEQAQLAAKDTTHTTDTP
jgi:hypothetical protein